MINRTTMKNPEVLLFAIFNFIMITMAVTGYLKHKKSSDHSPNQVESTKQEQQRTQEQNPINIRFDSVALSKVFQLVIDETQIKEIALRGEKPIYTQKDFETKDQRFNHDEFFAAKELGLISEAQFFEILEKVYPKHYASINQYHLSKTCIASLHDKQRLVDLVNSTNQDQYALETNLLIESNQFYEDKSHIKKIIERVKKLDDDQFRYGEFGKYNLMNALLLRYAHENIDDYAIQNNREIASFLKENKRSFQATDLHISSIDTILYFEPFYCLNTLSYIYNNVDPNKKEQLKALIDVDSNDCLSIFTSKDLVGMDEIISQAKEAGIQSFDISPMNRLFLNGDHESYGDDYPITKIIQYSNIAFPLIEELSEKVSPVQMNAKLYFHHLKKHLKNVEYLVLGSKSYLLIQGNNGASYGFDVSSIKGLENANNTLTAIFNYALQKEGIIERLIPMPAIFETLMISEPSKTKKFLDSLNVDTNW